MNNATNPPKFRRKKILIDPLQIKFAGYSLVIFVVIALGLWLEIMGAFKNLQELVKSYDPASPLNIQMKNVTIFLSNMVLFKLVTLILVIWFVAIFISHRFVGPLYRLRECLKKARDGDLSIRMHLRKGDAFQDIADKFNKMMDSIVQKMTTK